MDHNIPQLIDDIYYLLNEHRDTFSLQSNDYYYSKLAQKSRFDTADVIFIKRLLQVELNETLEIRLLTIYLRNMFQLTKNPC